MNGFFVLLGIESWKPVLAALLLPPVPLLVLLLIGVRLVRPWRGLGWFVVLASVALLWLSSTLGAAQVASRLFLHPPPALTFDRVKALRAEVQARGPVAIVVLGGGMEPHAPEYGVANLQHASLERLRYGIWLSRETGAPVAFSGGTGHAQREGLAEAQVAARIAQQDYGRPLKWVEDESRDTRENARRSVALLQRAGIAHIVLVTHGWHMPRAVRAFEQAAEGGMRIEAAPMGLAPASERPSLLWIPSPAGHAAMNRVLHELAGLAAGA